MALERLKDSSFDVIVSDYLMPYIDGLEFLKKIRENDDETPVIILTGKSNENIVIDAMNLGTNYYLQKRMDSMALFQELTNYILLSAQRKSKIIQKHEEEIKFKKYEQYFKYLVDFTNVFVYTLDLNLHIIDFFGKGFFEDEDSSMYLGKSLSDILGQQLANVHENYSRIAMSGQKLSYQWNISIDSSSKYYQTLLIPIKNEQENLTEIVGISHDITTLKIALNAIIEKEKFYEEMLGNIGSSYAVYRPLETKETNLFSHLTFLDISQTFEKIVNLTRDHIIGKKFEEIFTSYSYNLEQLSILFGNLTLNEKIFKTETYITFLKQWFSLLVYFNEHNSLVTVFTDITQYKENELNLNKQKEENDFWLELLTHDIKNYLITLKGYLDLLFMSNSLSKENHEILQKCQINFFEASNLISNITLLLKQKISTQIELFPVNIEEQIEKCLLFTEECFQNKKIQLNLKSIPKPYVLADNLFFDLLLNVLTNAIKHDPKDEVKIDIIISEDPDIPTNIVLKISDYGTGISPQERPILYQPFSQYRRHKTGSGLGLYLIKTLIDRYNGNISIENHFPEDYRLGTTIVLGLKKASI